MSALRLPALIALLLLLSACSSSDPQAVSQRYWEALIAGDQQTAQELTVSDARDNLSEAIDPSPETRVSFDHPVRESYAGPNDETRTARVPTTVHWVDEDQTTTFETETVLVFEEGEWKVEPALTQEAFFESVYRSALTGLEAALEDSAKAFRQLGSELSASMARELTAVSRELQVQTEKASAELQQFLEGLDEELRQELERNREDDSP